jgi:hypothetical protein
MIWGMIWEAVETHCTSSAISNSFCWKFSAGARDRVMAFLEKRPAVFSRLPVRVFLPERQRP